MYRYLRGDGVNPADFVPYVEPGPHLQSRGADPQTLIRLDWDDPIGAAGVFQCGPCEIDIIQAHDEHSVVLEGEVVITESETGRSTRYGPGDCFILNRGDRFKWEVQVPRFRKSFFMIKPGARGR